MKNVIEFIREKIYYVMAGTVILVVLLVLISACSGKGDRTYLSLEDKMIDAAIKYYSTRSDGLPKNDGGTTKITMSALVDAETLKKPITDPKDKENICDGYVQVRKVGKEYIYIGRLTCPGSYEPKKLVDVLKKQKLDEYGNGLYQMGDEYVFRGDDVNNYVKFNDQMWQIVKIDSEGRIELLLAESKNLFRSAWDNKYNSEIEKYHGVTTDYLHTDMRKMLEYVYDTNFSLMSKAFLTTKNLCVGPKYIEEAESIDTECSIIKENEHAGLLRITDYQRASLGDGCVVYDDAECTNRNYLSDIGSTWLLTTVADNTYQAYTLSSYITYKKASLKQTIKPVVFLVKDAYITSGNGTYEKPYQIKY